MSATPSPARSTTVSSGKSVVALPDEKVTCRMTVVPLTSVVPLVLPLILIIEDDRIICTILDDLLSELGYRVDCVHDGRCGIEAIRTETPALVLLDVGLPIIDGEGVLQRIADDDPYPQVILMTTDPRGFRIVDAYPVAGYLPKPFDLDTVIGLVETHIY